MHVISDLEFNWVWQLLRQAADISCNFVQLFSCVFSRLFYGELRFAIFVFRLLAFSVLGMACVRVCAVRLSCTSARLCGAGSPGCVHACAIFCFECALSYGLVSARLFFVWGSLC